MSWAKHPLLQATPFALAVATLPSPLLVTWHPPSTPGDSHKAPGAYCFS